MKKTTIILLFVLIIGLIATSCSLQKTQKIEINEPIEQELNEYDSLSNSLGNSEFDTIEQDLDFSDI